MDGKQDDQKSVPLSERLEKIVRWLLTEAAPVVDAGDCNWKLIINGGPGYDIKTVIEQYKTI